MKKIQIVITRDEAAAIEEWRHGIGLFRAAAYRLIFAAGLKKLNIKKKERR